MPTAVLLSPLGSICRAPLYRTILSRLACFVLIGSALAGAGQADVIFVPTGDLAGAGFHSEANALSANGDFSVGAGTSTASGSNGREALLWDDVTGSVPLGDLPGGNFFSIAHAVSGAGEFVVGESSSSASGVNSSEAFLWSEADDDMIGLGDLAGGTIRSVALAVSGTGDIVVGYSSSAATGANANEAFVWRDEDDVMEALGSLSGGTNTSRALGISIDGGVVVGESSSTASGANDTEAFSWTEDGGLEALGDLAGGRFSSHATAVSGNGLVVVGASSSAASGTNAVEAFRVTASDGMEGLGDLAGGFFDSEALAASHNGDTIVGVGQTAAGETAFLWSEAEGMRSMQDVIEDAGVDLTGWRLTQATGVSLNGDVVTGAGVNPQGNDEGWVVFLPEPGGAASGLAALATLQMLARRRAQRAR